MMIITDSNRKTLETFDPPSLGDSLREGEYIHSATIRDGFCLDVRCLSLLAIWPVLYLLLILHATYPVSISLAIAAKKYQNQQ